MFGSGDEENQPTAETLRSSADGLRTWLLVNIFFAVVFLVMLGAAQRPLSLVGVVLLVHIVSSLAVLYAYHCAAVVDALFKAAHGTTSSMPGVTEPSWLLGSGGTKQSFVAYLVFNALYTLRLAAWDRASMTLLPSAKLSFDALFYIQMVAAFLFGALSVVYVQLGKEVRAPVLIAG